jgi:hypothetical protein
MAATEVDDDFARACADSNRRRLRALAPLMVALHLVHVAIFYTSASLAPTLTASVLRWRHGIVITHLLTLPLPLLLGALAFAPPTRPRLAAWIGPLALFGYILHGAVITSIDQLVTASMTVYVGYGLGLAVIVLVRPAVAMCAYLLGAAVLLGGVLNLGSQAAVGTNLPIIITVTAISTALSWMIFGARRREHQQGRIIAHQREELAALNAGLEARVAAQVQEIGLRHAEVERLNTELRSQVRARSTELSQALSRLASGQGGPRGLEPGVLVADRFVVQERLGEGGMGVVHAGLDRSTGARVAIKVVQAASSGQLDALRRFIREAGTTAAIGHPAVVRVLHLDASDDGLLYQVQELVEGQTLATQLGRAWTPGEVARCGSVLADALAAAHAQGVIHRDVKPENVMLTRSSPGLKLLDFGVAKLNDLVASDRMTTAAVVLGTPAYMAPEQVDPACGVDARADVYAAGVVLHELACGRLPIDAPGARELMARKLTSEPELEGFVPELPRDLATLIWRCLQREPGARPTAHQLALGLTQLADAAGQPPLEALTHAVSRIPSTTIAERKRAP